jgi:hypothetical protein
MAILSDGRRTLFDIYEQNNIPLKDASPEEGKSPEIPPLITSNCVSVITQVVFPKTPI